MINFIGMMRRLTFQRAFSGAASAEGKRRAGSGRNRGDAMFNVVHKWSQSKGDYYCVYDGGRLVFRTTVSTQANEWLKRNPGYVEPPARPAPVRKDKVA
jgi:hypothetical protein